MEARPKNAASSSPPSLVSAYGVCEALVREGDKDRWLATLFAPADKRPHLHALYAFNYEVARVRELVSDPLPGEVRYQWWRDTLEGEARGDVRAHPVAAAIIGTIARFRLPRRALTDLIEAREFDLYDDPMPSLHQLEGYCGETASSLIRLATLILDDGARPADADAAGHVGTAYAITGLLRALPWQVARGQVYVPADVLERHGAGRSDLLGRRKRANVLAGLAELRAHARKHLAAARGCGGLPPHHAAAYLPACLVEANLRLMERPGYDPYTTTIEVPQWRRQWLLWRAARRFASGKPAF